MRIVIVALLLLIGTMLSGCFTELHLKVPQGNILTAHEISELRLGMTTRQVTFILGTPLVRDPFNPGRWDYFNSTARLGGKPVQHRLTLFFNGDTLVKAEGDLAPAALKAGKQAAPAATTTAPAATTP